MGYHSGGISGAHCFGKIPADWKEITVKERNMRYWIWRMQYKMENLYNFLYDFFWVCQAYFRGKVWEQDEYQFRVIGCCVKVPSAKMTGRRIKMLARMNGYILLDAGSLRWMLKQQPLGDYSAYLADEWQEHRTWPKVGQFIEGDGTHGEAYIANPPHFLVCKK
jgi:hypothetical protein